MGKKVNGFIYKHSLSTVVRQFTSCLPGFAHVWRIGLHCPYLAKERLRVWNISHDSALRFVAFSLNGRWNVLELGLDVFVTTVGCLGCAFDRTMAIMSPI